MLKAQIRSKLCQFSLELADKEDILTGDFFGVLDYLPRQPYLHEFLESVCALNHARGRFELGRVDWQSVEMRFWPRYQVHDDTTEPDVVLLSDHWIIVIEVKLGSGLGRNQPWREYLVGQYLAQERGLPSLSVYYMILSRERLDVAQVFSGLEDGQRAELIERTLFFRWSQAVSLVEGWLRNGAGGRPLGDSEARLLADLYAVLRRRRTLAFLGFRFPHQQPVEEPERAIFCPLLFEGFLNTDIAKTSLSRSAVFLSRFQGFLHPSLTLPVVSMESMQACGFQGFVRSTVRTDVPPASIFCPLQFQGFAKETPRCAASPTMASAFQKETRAR